jgi:hypothetical protein
MIIALIMIHVRKAGCNAHAHQDKNTMKTVFQRSNWWKWLVALAIVGAVLATLPLIERRDPDIDYVGPKTNRIREILHGLDVPIDMTKFKEPLKLKLALEALFDHWEPSGCAVPVLANQWEFETSQHPEIYNLVVTFPADTRQLTVREFLRHILAQLPGGGTAIIHQMGLIELTTRSNAAQVRDDYDAEISVVNRLRQFWAEVFGWDGPLPPPPSRAVSKRLDAAA